MNNHFNANFQLWFLLTSCIVLLPSCGPNSETPSQAVPHIQQPKPSTAPISSAELQKVIEIINKQPLTIKDFERRVAAVKQIGVEKRVGAVPLLLDKLFQITPLTINNAVDSAETYPCSAALVQIGEPAVPELERRFLKAGSNLEQLVLLDTLLNIKGAAFVAEWIEKLPKSGNNALSEQRRAELKQWTLSQAQ
jgi:hypothetical protein